MLAGCSAAPNETEPETGEVQNALFTPTGTSLWPGGVVPVCFDSSSTARSDFATQSKQIQDIVTELYGRAASIQFVGWGTCSASPTGTIRVFINNGVATTFGLGYSATGPRDTYIDTTYPLYRSMVAEEFGHALGFTHEMNRPDTDAGLPPGACGYGYTPQAGNTWNTDWDPDSIAIDTYGECLEGNATLSRWDVVGLRNSYGRRSNGTIVGRRGKCIDIPNPNLTQPPDGSLLRLWDCQARNSYYTPNQFWAWREWATGPNASTIGAFSFNNVNMDVQWGSLAEGTPVWTWSSNGDDAQKFAFTDVAIKGMGDLCMNRRSELIGTPPFELWTYTPELRPCTAATEQKFSLVPLNDVSAGGVMVRATALGAAGENLCLRANNPSGTAPVVFRPCDATDDNQRFSMSSSRITTTAGKCIEVIGNRPDDGAALQTATCRSLASPSDSGYDPLRQAQDWLVTGRIRQTRSGQTRCMFADSPDSTYPLGTPIEMKSCTGAKSEEWDYWF